VHILCIGRICVGDTLMAARSQPNDDWGSVGNGAKSRRKACGCGMCDVRCIILVQYRKLSTGSLD